MSDTFRTLAATDEGECPDLDAVADDLRTVARLVEQALSGEVTLSDDLPTILADLAAACDQWHEAVSD